MRESEVTEGTSFTIQMEKVALDKSHIVLSMVTGKKMRQNRFNNLIAS